MIFEQLASAAMLFAKFHAGTRKSLRNVWLLLLKQPMKFVLNVNIRCSTISRESLGDLATVI